MLSDTSEALRWLDHINDTVPNIQKSHFKSFTFDFKSLYDSLKPELVKEALEYAIQMSRPDWSEDFRKWILSLVDLSFRASVGKFKGDWFRQLNGVPTGGSLCVQLANITVYYVLYKTVYSVPGLMKDVKSIKRYIDDGADLYTGSTRQFKTWISNINDSLKSYSLYIDENNIQNVGHLIPFLDIQFCFDRKGDLVMDLYVKETDARSYLNFSSAHPNHIYSGIVYSQCLRLRRIIISTDRLKQRIDELCECFLQAGYPANMVKNISNKVVAMDRDLTPRNQSNQSVSDDCIRVITTYGCDEHLIKSVKSAEKSLLRTRSFSRSQKVFQFVNKTAYSLRNQLSSLKNLALGNKHGQTTACNSNLCSCCELISMYEEHNVNGTIVKSVYGTCKTYNIIYLAECHLCNISKFYVGRTTTQLNTRCNGHRSKYYAILKNRGVLSTLEAENEEYSLGIHLYNDHHCRNYRDFNEHYTFNIIQNSSPKNLEIHEHKWIHRLNTLHPNGINTGNPFGIPLLNI